MNMQTALRNASSRALAGRMTGIDTEDLIESFSLDQKKCKVAAKVKKESRRERR